MCPHEVSAFLCVVKNRSFITTSSPNYELKTLLINTSEKQAVSFFLSQEINALCFKKRQCATVLENLFLHLVEFPMQSRWPRKH